MEPAIARRARTVSTAFAAPLIAAKVTATMAVVVFAGRAPRAATSVLTEPAPTDSYCNVTMGN